MQKGNTIVGECFDDRNGYSIFLSYCGCSIAVGGGLYGENEGDEFGYSVSLSGDSDTVAIGSPFNDDNGNDTGCIKVFISRKI